MHSGEIRPDRFPATNWSLVTRTGGTDDATAHASLLTLCLRYWYPVFAYLRRSGHAPERAYALAQAFFQDLLRRDTAQPEAARFGRFRLFLQAELHRFLSSDHDLQQVAVALAGPSLQDLEARHRTEVAPDRSPEEMLRRGFALEILAAAHRRLHREAAESGRLPMFADLERFLVAEPRPGDNDDAARRLQVRPVFVAMAVKRLRQRFRELVDHELRETIAGASDLESERDALLQVLGSGE